jgi:eukaryotic-like serine/threonine-protein kinase
VTSNPTPIDRWTGPRPIGRVIANYEIVAPIGAGGMGRVYEARHVVLQRRVALKVLRASAAESPQMRVRFLNEARAIAAIEHPNVVTIYDAGVSEDGIPFLAMELLEGETLAKRIATRRLSLTEATLVVSDLAAGVAAAHARNIIHRDLKPANIILVRGAGGVESAKILDFGVAKLLGALAPPEQDVSRTGFVVGTPGYMAPEQCLGSTVDARADLFAIGVIFYRALAGESPYPSSASSGTAAHLRTTGVPIPLSTVLPDVPRSVEAFVMRCLERDPDRRFGSALELTLALHEMVAVDPPSITKTEGWRSPGIPAPIPTEVSPRSDVAVRPSRSYRRWAWLLPIGAVAGVLVAVGVTRTGATTTTAVPVTEPRRPLAPPRLESAPVLVSEPTAATRGFDLRDDGMKPVLETIDLQPRRPVAKLPKTTTRSARTVNPAQDASPEQATPEPPAEPKPQATPTKPEESPIPPTAPKPTRPSDVYHF